MTPDAPGLRARKKAQTRRTLSRCAMELIERQGLDATSVEQIAAAADVSPRTFFNYFASKEDAAVGWTDEEMVPLLEAIRAHPGGSSSFDVLTGALKSTMSLRPFDREETLLRLRVAGAEPRLAAQQGGRFSQFEATLVEALAERRAGEPGDELEDAVVVATTLAALRTALMRWSLDAEHGSPQAFVDDALSLLAHGLSSA